MNPPAGGPIPVRVLVIDDEDLILFAVRKAMAGSGFELTLASSGEEGLDYLRKTPYAVILSDQQMPGMSGLEFFEQARQIRPSACRVLVTAVLNINTVIRAINRGEIYRFIAKPWARQELLAVVNDAARHHELNEAHRNLHRHCAALNRQLIRLAAVAHRLFEMSRPTA